MVKTKDKTLIAIVVSTLLLIPIMIFFNNSYVISWNNSVNTLMQKIQINFFVEISKMLSFIFSTKSIIFITIIVAGYLFLNNKKRASAMLIFAVVLRSAIVTLLKLLYHVQRPINSLIYESDFSFPSGHASIAVVLLGLFIYYYTKSQKKNKKTIVSISFAIIILVALSRLYLNIHWLTDVVAGLLIGLICLLLIIWIFKKKA